MKKLENKVALVTGGARGMGASHVERFIAEGAKVYFTDLLTDEGEALSKSLGQNAIFIKHDVTKEDDWKTVMKIIEAETGRLDVLVNNAGITSSGMIGEASLDSYMKVINVNQISVFLGLTYALPLLKKSTSGSVINISSIAGLKALAPGSVSYASSKYAVRGITQIAALEFSEYNIRVNSVHPGFVDTPIFKGAEAIPDEALNAFVNNIPMKRLGRSEELTNMVLFLASEDSSYCTAGEYVVDGGLMLK